MLTSNNTNSNLKML